MVLISLTKGLSKNKHTCKAEVGYMNRLPLIAGYPPATANITITHEYRNVLSPVYLTILSINSILFYKYKGKFYLNKTMILYFFGIVHGYLIFQLK